MYVKNFCCPDIYSRLSIATYTFTTTAHTKVNISKAADMFGEAVQKAEQSQAKELESDSGGGDGDGGGGSGLDPESLLQRVLAKQVPNSFPAIYPFLIYLY